jgi:hypothetical protein
MIHNHTFVLQRKFLRNLFFILSRALLVSKDVISPGHKKPRTGNRTERTGNWNRKNRNQKIRFLFGSCSLRTEIPRLILG